METLQQTLGVLVVFGLLGATLWWLRRRGLAHVSGITRRRKGGTLQSMECLPLSAGNALHLVRVGDRAILIAASPAGCHLLESGPLAQFESHLSAVKS
ncbi:MAG: flagellar biosynthetic protein FliO [Candidatus Solibacter sp.]